MSDFEKLYYESNEFWKEGAVNTDDNICRLERTEKLIPFDVKSLIDIGCGNGLFVNKLISSKKEIEVWGTDRSIKALAYVKGNKFLSSITEIPKSDSSFDCVTCLQVLEHIPYPDYRKALQELTRLSCKYILISVPFEEDIKSNFTECPKCRSEFNSDLHFRSYSKQDIIELFVDYGFELVQFENVVKKQRYLGYEFYKSIKSKITKDPKETKKFNSPICPLCGYENSSFDETINLQNSKRKRGKFRSFLISILKRSWPKKNVKGYWIIALYKRMN